MLPGSPGATVVDQLSIFLENETGGLADVVDVLARAQVDLCGSS